jgi:hypothetical protein
MILAIPLAALPCPLRPLRRWHEAALLQRGIQPRSARSDAEEVTPRNKRLVNRYYSVQLRALRG